MSEQPTKPDEENTSDSESEDDYASDSFNPSSRTPPNNEHARCTPEQEEKLRFRHRDRIVQARRFRTSTAVDGPVIHCVTYLYTRGGQVHAFETNLGNQLIRREEQPIESAHPVEISNMVCGCQFRVRGIDDRTMVHERDFELNGRSKLLDEVHDVLNNFDVGEADGACFRVSEEIRRFLEASDT